MTTTRALPDATRQGYGVFYLPGRGDGGTFVGHAPQVRSGTLVREGGTSSGQMLLQQLGRHVGVCPPPRLFHDLAYQERKGRDFPLLVVGGGLRVFGQDCVDYRDKFSFVADLRHPARGHKGRRPLAALEHFAQNLLSRTPADSTLVYE